MITIGPIHILTDVEYGTLRQCQLDLQFLVTHGRPVTHQELLRAAMAADAHLHEDPDHPNHEAHRRAVCEQLVEAIGLALSKGV